MLDATGTDMTFAVYMLPQAAEGKVRARYLSASPAPTKTP